MSHGGRVAVEEHAAFADEHGLDPVGEVEQPRVGVCRVHRARDARDEILGPSANHLIPLIGRVGEDVPPLMEHAAPLLGQGPPQQLGGRDLLREVLDGDVVVPPELFVRVPAGEVEIGLLDAVAVRASAGVSKHRLDFVHEPVEGLLVSGESGRIEGPCVMGQPVRALVVRGREGLGWDTAPRVPLVRPSPDLVVGRRVEGDRGARVVPDVGADLDEPLLPGAEGLDRDVPRLTRLEEEQPHRVGAVRVEHIIAAHQRVEARQVQVARRLAVLIREVTPGGLFDAPELEGGPDAFVVERGRRQLRVLASGRRAEPEGHADDAEEDPPTEACPRQA